MDTRTGDIVNMDTVEKLKLDPKTAPQAKWYKEIPPELLPQLEGMNRKQRRAWYSQNKHLFKKISLEDIVPIKTVEESFKENI